jgi:SAM-dependent methyltransferase
LHGGNYDGFFAQQTRILQWLIRRTLIKAHIVIILSERLRSMFQFEPRIASRVRVVPNGLPLELVGCSQAKRLPSNREVPVQILYLSNLIKSKGYFDLLRAIELLINRYQVNVEAHFCGVFHGEDGTPECAQREERDFAEFVQEHRLGSRVHYHGLVLEKKKTAFLQSCHILALPTNYVNEGQPISIIEALAYGTVVVSSAHRAIPDMVIDGITGRLVPFGNAERLAEVVAEIVLDPVVYVKMSAAAYEHYRNNYTAESHLYELQGLLSGVCRGGAQDTPRTTAYHLKSATMRAVETARYFDKASERWADRYRMSRSFSARLSRFGQLLLTECTPQSRILDFGCGTGELAKVLCDAGYDIWALDSSEAMLEGCRKLLKGKPAHYLGAPPGSWSRIDVPDGWFDAVVASSVLEYVGDVEAQLKEIARALRGGGTLLMTVPNQVGLVRHLERWVLFLRRCRMFRSLMSMFPARVREHLRYLDGSINRWGIDTWVSILGTAGFESSNFDGVRAPLTMIKACRGTSCNAPAPTVSSADAPH